VSEALAFAAVVAVCDGLTFKGHVERVSGRVVIGIVWSDRTIVADALARTRVLVEALLADDSHVRREIGAHVLPLYTGVWRETDAPVDAEQIAEAVALREVHLSAEPAYGHTFQYHAPRWLSGGHRMEATLDAVGDVKSVTLAEPYFRA
jgi:hypothetical protein